MSENIESLEMTDEEVDEYFLVAFQMGNTTGFSKGTRSVSARDLKKLKPLIKFYAKKAHPFRACVNDNRKRFGPLTEKYCAIIKDLIKGSTKWRSENRKKSLSDDTLRELFALDIPDDFFAFLSELEDDEVQSMIEEEKTEFAEGDLVWHPDAGYNALRGKIELALNGTAPEYSGGDYAYGGSRFWVEDMSTGEALVCEGGKDYYVVGFTVDKKGEVTLADESDWKPVERAWVEEKVKLSDEHVMAEMFFSTKASEAKIEGDFIWKPILREGEWKFSPSSGGAAAKPITIVKNGKSDKKGLVISMAELKKNFEDGAIEHVTIPASHADTVLENTGFIRKLRFSKDDEGRAILEAAMDFTEPDVKKKATNGSIANTSAGILFDYIHKESGKKFRSVLAHAALTNRPWLNGMKPFGVNASDDLQVIGFSEELYDTSGRREDMPNEDGNMDFSELGFEDLDSLKAALAERKSLKDEARQRDVTDLCKSWQEKGHAPALVAEAQTIMMSDEGATVLNLSEDGKQVSLSASDIVKRLVDVSPAVKLDQDQVTEQQATEETQDEEEESKLSEDEKRVASQIFFDEGVSMDVAIEKAKQRLATASK